MAGSARRAVSATRCRVRRRALVCVLGVVSVAGAAALSGVPAMAASEGATARFSIEVADVLADEGSGVSPTEFVFTMTLTPALAYEVEVVWATSDRTAEADSDYLTASGTVRFAPGDVEETFTVSVVGDSTEEPDETFVVTYGLASPPAPAPRQPPTPDPVATATIVDDDSVPSSDLGLTVASSPDPVAVGLDLTYDIDVSSNGPDTATMVSITDQLDETVVLVSATASTQCGAGARLGCRPQAIVCTYDTAVSCLVGNLSNGMTASATVVVRTTRTTGELANLASVSSSVTDPDEENNSAWDFNAVVADGLGCTVVGSNEAETIDGTAGNDVICGRGGDDILRGGAGDDELRGGAGGDVMDGAEGTDLLLGWTGEDTFVSSPGADAFDGGGGWDSVTYGADPVGVTVSLRAGTSTDGWTAVDSISSIGRAYGSDFADTLRGSTEANVIDGRDGDDSIYGHAGNDVLLGGDGQDLTVGHRGTDSCEAETTRTCEG